ncbi:MAG: ligase-associated DNA damage response endonuclease PdeM [Oscillochloris sp.]|nr:ligase-associated DNA damage response endonuclease PdeM [Oscillochloris sp.]
MTVGECLVEVAGATLALLPERAIYWPAERTLLLADLHLGKAASFRAAAIAVPEDVTGADLARLDHMLARTGATRMIILGDLLHARSSRDQGLLAALALWRSRYRGLPIVLVRGNHDRSAGDPPQSWAITCVDAPYYQAPFALCHEPDQAAEHYTLAGHLHPAVELRGRGKQRERLPGFIFGPHRGLLPAFGSFTGAATIRPNAQDRVYVIADNTVIGPL